MLTIDYNRNLKKLYLYRNGFPDMVVIPVPDGKIASACGRAVNRKDQGELALLADICGKLQQRREEAQ